MRRKKYIVSKLQLKLLFFFLIYQALSCLIFSLLIFYPITAEFNGSNSPENLVLSNVFIKIHTVYWPCFIFFMAFFFVHSVVVTHRFSGPMIRFQQVFKSMSDLKFPSNFKLRKRDYLKQEAHEFKNALKKVKSALEESIYCTTQIENICLGSEDEKLTKDEILRNCEKIRSLLSGDEVEERDFDSEIESIEVS